MTLRSDYLFIVEASQYSPNTFIVSVFNGTIIEVKYSAFRFMSVEHSQSANKQTSFGIIAQFIHTHTYIYIYIYCHKAV